MNNPANNHLFITQDTELAAWLCSQGVSLIRTEREGKQSSFIFNQPDEQLLIEFRMGTATGNIHAFFRAYKAMLKLVHVVPRG